MPNSVCPSNASELILPASRARRLNDRVQPEVLSQHPYGLRHDQVLVFTRIDLQNVELGHMSIGGTTTVWISARFRYRRRPTGPFGPIGNFMA